MKKSHHGKPVGNSPEFIPLDTHLNQDVHQSHNLHATVTSHLPEDDPNKFSSSTPQRMLQSYMRIFDPIDGVAPTGDRIIQDITRVLISMEKVKEMRGCIIDENQRSGRRFIEHESGEKRNGGYRHKKTQKEYLQQVLTSSSMLHNDALSAVRQNYAIAMESLRVVDDEDDNDINSNINQNNE